MPQMNMHVRSVTLLREGAYGFDGEKVDPTKPFVCKHEINLPAEVSAGIMSLIANELAEEGKRVAQMMTAQAFEVQSLPAPKVCINHPDRPSSTNLDNEELCKECTDAWVRGEGDAARQRDLDDEIPF